MKRWNGWGDDSVQVPMPDGASSFLRERVGPASAPVDARLDDVAARVPPSRLPEHPAIQTDPVQRVRHACGQSLPDWVAMRSGRIPQFHDGVAMPATAADVQELLGFAARTRTALIPYGGGTSVVGHIQPPADRPSLCVDLSRMSQLMNFDERSQLATFGAGITGPALEAILQARGFTLGHYPQSWELSTLGGWIAARSSGQQSALYGRIERLMAGARVLTPLGELNLPPFPASAAGPDLRDMLLGSEGRMGIITDAAVRVTRLPEHESFHGLFLPDWDQGIEAVRALAQAQVGCSMIRLSTPVETESMLALSGHTTLTRLLDVMLKVRGSPSGRCMLVLAFTGSERSARALRRHALSIVSRFGAVDAGTLVGKTWSKSRFRSPYLRNTLWEAGYAIDTLETATTWTNVAPMVTALETSLRQGLQAEHERVHAFTHLSHVYPTGSSIYSTYVFRLADDPAETLRRWQALKSAASDVIVRHGGTISHQHGVGVDHQRWLSAEKSTAGIGALRTMLRYWDPDGIMNPGKLVGLPPRLEP